MTQPSVTAHIHQAFYVHRHLASHISFYPVGFIDDLPDPRDLLLAQLIRFGAEIHACVMKDVSRTASPYSIDIGQRYLDPFSLR